MPHESPDCRSSWEQRPYSPCCPQESQRLGRVSGEASTFEATKHSVSLRNRKFTYLAQAVPTFQRGSAFDMLKKTLANKYPPECLKRLWVATDCTGYVAQQFTLFTVAIFISASHSDLFYKRHFYPIVSSSVPVDMTHIGCVVMWTPSSWALFSPCYRHFLQVLFCFGDVVSLPLDLPVERLSILATASCYVTHMFLRNMSC